LPSRRRLRQSHLSIRHRSLASGILKKSDPSRIPEKAPSFFLTFLSFGIKSVKQTFVPDHFFVSILAQMENKNHTLSNLFLQAIFEAARIL
jgi:hypothetical protein